MDMFQSPDGNKICNSLLSVGTCYLEHMPEHSTTINPYIFFGILFGSSVVEPYVGSLAIASIVDNALSLTDKATSMAFSESSFQSAPQIQRPVEIATHLRERISIFVNGEISLFEFHSSCRREAFSLWRAMNGNEAAGYLLNAIASGLVSATYSYSNVPTWARSMYNWAFDAFDTSSIFDTTQNLHTMASLEKEVKKAIMEVDIDEVKGQAAEECGKKKNGADLDALLKKLSVPKLLKLLWRFNVYDVTRTVKEAAKRVLDDCGENYTLRLEKATALNILGREFHDAVAFLSNDGKEFDVQEIESDVKAALLESITSDEFFE